MIACLHNMHSLNENEKYTEFLQNKNLLLGTKIEHKRTLSIFTN